MTFINLINLSSLYTLIYLGLLAMACSCVAPVIMHLLSCLLPRRSNKLLVSTGEDRWAAEVFLPAFGSYETVVLPPAEIAEEDLESDLLLTAERFWKGLGGSLLDTDYELRNAAWELLRDLEAENCWDIFEGEEETSQRAVS